jgi:hypothetical protein
MIELSAIYQRCYVHEGFLERKGRKPLMERKRTLNSRRRMPRLIQSATPNITPLFLSAVQGMAESLSVDTYAYLSIPMLVCRYPYLSVDTHAYLSIPMLVCRYPYLSVATHTYSCLSSLVALFILSVEHPVYLSILSVYRASLICRASLLSVEHLSCLSSISLVGDLTWTVLFFFFGTCSLGVFRPLSLR